MTACEFVIYEAKIIKNITDKYLGLNKEEINGLVIHPPVKDAKFIDIPIIKAGRFGDTYRSWLDFDNDGNPDVRQENDDKHDVIDILINGNWVELMIGVPM